MLGACVGLGVGLINDYQRRRQSCDLVRMSTRQVHDASPDIGRDSTKPNFPDDA